MVRGARAAGAIDRQEALGRRACAARAPRASHCLCRRAGRAGVERARRPRRGDDVQPELIADCVHCGFCLPTCPTYALWHEEMDSPRGRIHLMSGLVDGSLELTDTVVEHFDRCLGCMACVTSCPSGVQYDRLIESTRAYIEENHERREDDRLLRSLIFRVFPYPRRLRAALAFRRLPAPGSLRVLQDLAPPWVDPIAPPEHLPGDGPRVAVVTGCVQSVVFGNVNAATA